MEWELIVFSSICILGFISTLVICWEIITDRSGKLARKEKDLEKNIDV